jgi:hypothetical protein
VTEVLDLEAKYWHFSSFSWTLTVWKKSNSHVTQRILKVGTEGNNIINVNQACSPFHLGQDDIDAPPRRDKALLNPNWMRKKSNIPQWVAKAVFVRTSGALVFAKTQNARTR